MFKIQLLIFKIFFIFFKKGHPFGILKWGKKETYLNIHKKIKNKNYIQIDKYEESLKSKIDINWLNELALQTQVVIKKSEINYQHGRILYAELSHYIKRKDSREVNVFPFEL